PHRLLHSFPTRRSSDLARLDGTLGQLPSTQRPGSLCSPARRIGRLLAAPLACRATAAVTGLQLAGALAARTGRNQGGVPTDLDAAACAGAPLDVCCGGSVSGQCGWSRGDAAGPG